MKRQLHLRIDAAVIGATNPLTLMVGRLDVRDTRDLLTQMEDTPPSHNGWRPMPEQRARLLTLNELEVDPEPKVVVIIDDVLATDSHFRAAKMIVRQRWPHMTVIGVFLARVCWRRNRSVAACSTPPYRKIEPDQSPSDQSRSRSGAPIIGFGEDRRSCYFRLPVIREQSGTIVSARAASDPLCRQAGSYRVVAELNCRI